MPIIVTVNDGDTFGPGFALQITTDTPGPWPSGSRWEFMLSASTETAFIPNQGRYFIENPNLPLFINNVGFAEGTWHDISPHPQLHDGSSGFLRVRLNSDAGVQETANIGVVVDLRSYVPIRLPAGGGTGGGGLTPVQAMQLETTYQSMGFAIGGGLGDLVVDLFTALGQRLYTHTLIGDLTGEGSLSQPPFPDPGSAFGIEWRIIDWPPGLGFDEGAYDRTEISYGQMSSIINRGADGDFATDTWYLDGINGSRIWGLGVPSAVVYYILPGVTVRAWWIRVGLSPTAASSASSSLP